MGEVNRLPPNDVSAEEAVLGSILVDPGAIEDVQAILQPGDFYREKNGWIYEAMLGVDAVNQITVTQELSRRGQLQPIGGAGYLSLLVERLPTSLHAEHYAGIVSRLAYCRRVISAAGMIAAIGYEAEKDSEAMQSRVRAIVDDLSPMARSEIYGPKDQAETIMAMVSKRQDQEPRLLRFGYSNIDRVLGGMADGDLTILAARPGVGKSQVLQEIARYHLPDVTVLWVSYEMILGQLLDREVAMSTGIPIGRLRSGRLSEAEWQKVYGVADKLYQGHLHVMGKSQPGEIMRQAKRLKDTADLRLVIFDYIQFAARTFGRAYGEDMRIKTANLTAFLKRLAIEVEVPVLAASQIGRGAETREGHKPTLSDLKECVAPGTEIVLENGSRRPISVVHKKLGLQTLGIKTINPESGEVSFVKPSAVLHTGKQRCFKVRLRSGKIIVVSENGKLLVDGQWVYAKDLKLGMRVATDAAQPQAIRRGVRFNSGASHFPKGQRPWNHGLTKKDDQRLQQIADKVAAKTRGKPNPKPADFKRTMRLVNPAFGTKMDNKGYVMVYRPDWPSSGGAEGQWQGYIYEHRLVMEQHLGRMLTKDERIHHLDGNKRNNAPDNLRLCETDKEHTELHAKEQRFVERLIQEGKVIFDESISDFRFR